MCYIIYCDFDSLNIIAFVIIQSYYSEENYKIKHTLLVDQIFKTKPVFNNLVELIDLNYLLEAFNHQVTSKLCQLLGPNTLLSPVITRS